MKVSILLLTINRYFLTREYVGKALAEAGYPFDLCITDNGSTEPEIFQWCDSKLPKVYFKNQTNEGTAQSLNRMIEANPSDYYVFIGNDIKLPKNWLKELIEVAEVSSHAGISGIDWRGQLYKPALLEGPDNSKFVWHTNIVFGTMFIPNKLRQTIGKFCEDYGPYGLWDSDYSIRAELAGFQNYYLSDLRSEHMGDDVNSGTDYRAKKDESLKIHRPIFEANINRYKQTNQVLIG